MKSITFRSPLVRKLEEKYGGSTKIVEMRKAEDVSHFLREKRSQEKKTSAKKIEFKKKFD